MILPTQENVHSPPLPPANNHEEEAEITVKKNPQGKVPSRAPKYLIERGEAITKFMKEPLPDTPNFKLAIQNAQDTEYQCAYILLLFKEKYEYEGLTASELSTILTKRFSAPMSPEAISRKLKKWATHVDPIIRGHLTIFNLKAKGELKTQGIRSRQIQGNFNLNKSKTS